MSVVISIFFSLFFCLFMRTHDVHSYMVSASLTTQNCNSLDTVDNCGACGNTCVFPQAYPICTNLIYRNGPDTGICDNFDCEYGGVDISYGKVSNSFIYDQVNQLESMLFAFWVNSGSNVTQFEWELGTSAFASDLGFGTVFSSPSLTSFDGYFNQRVLFTRGNGENAKDIIEIDFILPDYSFVIVNQSEYWITLSEAESSDDQGEVRWDINNPLNTETAYYLPFTTYVLRIPSAIRSESFAIYGTDHRCSFSNCSKDFADCNFVETDGCEVNFMQDSNHCGSCDYSCIEHTPLHMNYTGKCVNGQCGYVCDQNYFLCGTQCVSASDILSNLFHCSKDPTPIFTVHFTLILTAYPDYSKYRNSTILITELSQEICHFLNIQTTQIIMSTAMDNNRNQSQAQAANVSVQILGDELHSSLQYTNLLVNYVSNNNTSHNSSSSQQLLLNLIDVASISSVQTNLCASDGTIVSCPIINNANDNNNSQTLGLGLGIGLTAGVLLLLGLIYYYIRK